MLVYVNIEDISILICRYFNLGVNECNVIKILLFFLFILYLFLSWLVTSFSISKIINLIDFFEPNDEETWRFLDDSHSEEQQEVVAQMGYNLAYISRFFPLAQLRELDIKIRKCDSSIKRNSLYSYVGPCYHLHLAFLMACCLFEFCLFLNMLWLLVMVIEMDKFLYKKVRVIDILLTLFGLHMFCFLNYKKYIQKNYDFIKEEAVKNYLNKLESENK